MTDNIGQLSAEEDEQFDGFGVRPIGMDAVLYRGKEEQ